MITRRRALSDVALLAAVQSHSSLFGFQPRSTSPQQPLTEHKDCTFTSELVSLDNSSFERCTFQRCTIAYAGGPSRLAQNRFAECSFELVGGAANGLFLLRRLGLVRRFSTNVRATPSQIAVENSSGDTAAVG